MKRITIYTIGAVSLLGLVGGAMALNQPEEVKNASQEKTVTAKIEKKPEVIEQSTIEPAQIEEVQPQIVSKPVQETVQPTVPQQKADFNINNAIESYNFSSIPDQGYFKTNVVYLLASIMPHKFTESTYQGTFQYINKTFSCMSQGNYTRYAQYLNTESGWDMTNPDPTFQNMVKSIRQNGC